ncbi:hypothetical protein [Methanococcus maripaludis]|uniref:Uncharacterized protein n=1 Tax=Methanococcus maripaludis TaxID=39152 RepID=A0A7J9PQ96_METMI|nr:hypothetical protein [Methanococcus maripaludis]MBA2864900.1 hypothetical protein [Methanococcus maripaludis]
MNKFAKGCWTGLMLGIAAGIILNVTGFLTINFSVIRDLVGL